LVDVIAFPKLKIALLEDGQLDEAAVFLRQNWQLTYAGRLPQSLIAERTLVSFKEHLEERRNSCWLAWLGDGLIGLATTRTNCLEDIWVSRRFQRQGIATRLLDTVTQNLSRRGYHFAQVGCESFNRNAIDFFLATGWRKIGSEPVRISPRLRFDALVFSIELERVKSSQTPMK
jgi:GNAT superfamily N-acetyltransferase